MMNFKDLNLKTGLSLIEVMATLALLSFIMLALSSLQSGLLRSAVKTRDRVNHIIAMKNFLQEAHKNQWKGDELHQKTVDGMHLEYMQQTAQDYVTLKKYKNLVVERIIITWSGLLGEQKDEFINLLFIAPETTSENPEKDEQKEKKAA